MTSSAVLLMYMAYGMDVVEKVIPINFQYLILLGLFIAVATGIGAILLGEPFLSHTFGYVTLPIFGEIELATAMLFDIGVFFTVLGVTITIILTIASDQ
ncbi:Na(+)/H(+) antiporter subunit B1 [Lentibacillus sp. JNUCC-1]|nr:Na(+)/H(+) antiporter subunit B1 [Lentibacillus sp. JNUCC-1]